MSHEHKTSDMKSHAKASCARWLWRLVRRFTAFAWRGEIADRQRVDWLEMHSKILLTRSTHTCLYETFPLFAGPGTEEWRREYHRDERFCDSYRELIDLTRKFPHSPNNVLAESHENPRKP